MVTQSTAIAEPSTIEPIYRWLVDKWHQETAASSSASVLFNHPAYQAIIRLGWSVVPLIIHDLEAEPDHWFDALTIITGEDPVNAEDAGNLERMTQSWIRFARDRHYV